MFLSAKPFLPVLGSHVSRCTKVMPQVKEMYTHLLQLVPIHSNKELHPVSSNLLIFLCLPLIFHCTHSSITSYLGDVFNIITYFSLWQLWKIQEYSFSLLCSKTCTPYSIYSQLYSSAETSEASKYSCNVSQAIGPDSDFTTTSKIYISRS